MEQPTQTLHNLETEIANWRKNMLNGALTTEDVDELTQHLRDEMAALQAKGLNEEEAWLVARKRIGQPLAINEEFSKVNPDFTASRNLLMLFWGGAIFMILQSIFFSFPSLLWFIARRVERGHIDHVITNYQTQIILNVFTAVTVALVILTLSRSNNVAAWFGRILTKRSGVVTLILVLAGSFLASMNYITVVQGYFSHDRYSLEQPLQLLGFVFYGSLIFCTAWFTMRYREQEFRNIKAFSANINWITSLGLGTMLFMISSLGNMLRLHWLAAIITALLFIPAGWLIANSKTRALNLFMLQAFGMLIYWYFGYVAAHHTFMDTFVEHSVLVIAMFMGYFTNMRGKLNPQAA